MDSQIRQGIVRFAAYFALLGLIVPLPMSSQESEHLKPAEESGAAYIPKCSSTQASAAPSGCVSSIGPDGTVKDVEAKGGGAIFIDAVTKAVKQWRYLPTGEHQRVSEITVSFECCNTVTTIP